MAKQYKKNALQFCYLEIIMAYHKSVN